MFVKPMEIQRCNISQISLFHLTTNFWIVGEVHLLISSQIFHRPCHPFIHLCIPTTSSHKIRSTSPSLAFSYFLLLQGVSYKLYDIVQFHPCHFFPKVPPCFNFVLFTFSSQLISHLSLIISPLYPSYFFAQDPDLTTFCLPFW